MRDTALALFWWAMNVPSCIVLTLAVASTALCIWTFRLKSSPEKQED